MDGCEFPFEQLNFGYQRHIIQARPEPVHTVQELANQIRSRGCLLLDSVPMAL